MKIVHLGGVIRGEQFSEKFRGVKGGTPWRCTFCLAEHEKLGFEKHEQADGDHKNSTNQMGIASVFGFQSDGFKSGHGHKKDKEVVEHKNQNIEDKIEIVLPRRQMSKCEDLGINGR